MQTLSTPAQQPLQAGLAAPASGAQGGVIGVTSKSKDESIKIYNGRTHYNEWAFVYIQTAQRPGQSGVPVPGQQGRPGQQQGQPGPFGMQPGNMPGGRGNFPQPPPGFGSQNRPPINAPNSPFGNPNQNPNGQFTTPNGSTTFTPVAPGARRPGGGQ